MALTKNQEFLLKEVFTKLKYDKMSEKYKIYLDDYSNLKLTEEQMKLLEKMCIENDIELEKLPERIKRVDSEKLFNEYIQLKEQISKDPNNSKLKERKVLIKQKIATGYIHQIYKLINNKVLDLDKEQDREDIYQIGYEILMRFIDTYNPNKGVYFDEYLKYYIVKHIFIELLKNKKSLKHSHAMHLVTVINARKKLPVLDDETLIDTIAKETGLRKCYVEYLLLIEEASNYLSLEELAQDTLQDTQTAKNDVEEFFLANNIKENLTKLLEILPSNEKQVIMLYYGLVDGKRYKHSEIAEKLGYNTEERVRQVKEIALSKIRLPIYSIYINGLDNNSLEEYLSDDKTESEIRIREKRINELEESLLLSLPQPTLRNLVNTLPEMRKIVLELYYGLKDGKKYNFKEISEITGLTEYKVAKIKDTGLELLRKRIAKKKEYKRSEYLMLLTQKYLNSPKRKH